jgi:hypothetical protein
MDHPLIEMSLIQDDRVVLVRMPGVTMRPDKGNPHLNVLSMANYMDASRMARLSWRDDRQIRLQVYIRPVDAGQSLRALMDFADPRLILLESSKLDSPYRLGGSRSDLFAITRC